MKYFKLKCILVVLVFCKLTYSQNYTPSNAHSHNDYENPIPFFTAYDQGFGSIEADIFYFNDSLFVGHTFGDIQKKRTLQTFYLDQIKNKLIANHGLPYADSSKSLQLLIDIKTDPNKTLQKLVAILDTYSSIINAGKIKIVITGNRPKPIEFENYPSYIYFDGDLDKKYSSNELAKIGLFSADFTSYSQWNGKGIMVKADREKIDSIINSTHQKGKKIRFWASPDYLNAWQQFIKMKVDYINTDHIVALAKFLNEWSTTNVNLSNKQAVYLPKYKNDGVDLPVTKIILLIGDGCSLPQWYGGYTANGGTLTTFYLKHIGFSKTSSADNYVTDSAPGASSIATGEKIENRHLGIKPNGEPLKLITDYLVNKSYSIGLISSGDVSDATPAAFYAHEKERDSSIQIIQQLKNSGVQILAGASNDKINKISILQKKQVAILNNQLLDSLLPNYKIEHSINALSIPTNHKMLVLDPQAGLSMQEGRGDWLRNAFEKTTASLALNKNKQFFMMLEAAQIDYGGHANNIEYVVKEVIDFDQVIGQAIQYADENKGTLVIITGDHETGGLTLHDGDYKNQSLTAQFATNDHTGIPVPVFSYGYRSYLFDGVYENTELFTKIKKAIQPKSK
jgi:alkaline phosphatase